jgi:integrase
MAARNKLTAQQVKGAKAGDKLGDGGGLRLIVGKDGRRWWEYRYRFGGKDFTLGCGGQDTTLAEARKARDDYEDEIKAGRNPKTVKAAEKAMQASAGTVREMAQFFLATKGDEFSEKHRDKWLKPLEQHAAGLLSMPVAEVTTDHVLDVLTPIWSSKTDTAKRIRQRLARVLDTAKVRGKYDGQNPAGWEGHLALLLASPSKIHKVQHYRSDPYDAFPSIWVLLRKYSGSGPDLVRWIILTLVRSNEAREARWDEINWDEKVWEIPAHRMKGGEHPHSVPLTVEAIRLLRRREKEATGDLIFPNGKGTALTDVAVTKAFRRAGGEGTVHGIRSAFSNWAAETTSYGDDVTERALAHRDSNEVRAAYKRTDLMALRRQQLEDWVKYITSPRQLKVVQNG